LSTELGIPAVDGPRESITEDQATSQDARCRPTIRLSVEDAAEAWVSDKPRARLHGASSSVWAGCGTIILGVGTLPLPERRDID